MEQSTAPIEILDEPVVGGRDRSAIERHVSTYPKSMIYKSLPHEKNRKQRRKPKKVSKSKHIVNCNDRRTKTILGANILSMLGKVQQDTQDSIKKEILKEMPLSKFVETVSGKELPDYQKRLLDLHQQRHNSAEGDSDVLQTQASTE